MKILLSSLFVITILAFGISQTYAEEFIIEFPDHVVFIKGEAVIVHAWGVDFDSKNQLTGIILDNIGTQIDNVDFQIVRYTDVGDQGSVRIETDNSNYQVGTLYTIIVTYQGMERQLQFTLSDPPPTIEELASIVETQESSFNIELETLRNENTELRQQIINLNQRIDDLVSQITNLSAIVKEQIKVMMQFFQ